MNLIAQGQAGTTSGVSIPKAYEPAGFAYRAAGRFREQVVERGKTMTNGRNIAIAASLLGMLAAALVVGPRNARADELADLRANQQLLEQRLDQLAQAPVSPVGGLYP